MGNGLPKRTKNMQKVWEGRKMKKCGTCFHMQKYSNLNRLRKRCAISGDEVDRYHQACKYHSGDKLSKEGYKIAQERAKANEA